MSVTVKRAVREYKDLSFKFTAHPITNQLSIKKDDEAIKQSIKNLVLTRPGSRLFHPEIGCGIYSLLFEPASFTVKKLMEDIIKETLAIYEPRIEVITVNVSFPIPNEVAISIKYLIVNTTSPITINILVDRLV